MDSGETLGPEDGRDPQGSEGKERENGRRPHPQNLSKSDAQGNGPGPFP